MNCTRCGRRSSYLHPGGLCGGCHGTWVRMGRPVPFPPPKFARDLENRLNEVQGLMGLGVTTTSELARRIGVTERTIWRYKALLRAEP